MVLRYGPSDPRAEQIPAVMNLGASSFNGLGGSFQAQTEQAKMAQLMTAEQAKQFAALYDPAQNLALAKAQAGAMGDRPTFDPTVQATGIGEGIMKGAAKAIAFAPQQIAYNRQQQAYQQLAQQEQGFRQRQMEIMQNAYLADQTRRADGAQVLKPELRSIYGTLDPAGQNAMLGNAATKEVGISYAPGEAKAKATGDIAGKQMVLDWQAKRLKAVTGLEPQQVFVLANQGQLTPQIQSAWQYIYGGNIPKDMVDFQKRMIEVGTAQEGYKTAATNNLTLGERNEADLQGTILGNHGAQISNALKALELQYAPEKLQQEAEARNWTTQEKAKKFRDAEEIQQIVTSANILLREGTLTDSELIMMQTRLQALGGGDALGAIVDAYAPTSAKDNTPKIENFNKNKPKPKPVAAGWQAHPSGWQYNPATGEWKAP